MQFPLPLLQLQYLFSVTLGNVMLSIGAYIVEDGKARASRQCNIELADVWVHDHVDPVLHNPSILLHEDLIATGLCVKLSQVS